MNCLARCLTLLLTVALLPACPNAVVGRGGPGAHCLPNALCGENLVCQDSVCQASCDPGYFDDSGICEPCHDANCLVCSGAGSDACMLCDDGYYIYAGTCAGCDPSCASCDGPGAGDCLGCATGYAPDRSEYCRLPFVTVWDTSLGTDTTISLALSGTVDARIHWGDGTWTDVTDRGPHEHDYGTDGTYTVSVSGSVSGYNSFSNSGDSA